jgi:phosphoribosylanthranilate isomerase
MIGGIRIKICGLTSLVDAGLADQMGADYLGFILHEQSPRWVRSDHYAAMRSQLPGRAHVAVMVAPSQDELKAVADLGFSYFQLHFEPTIAASVLAGWAEVVGAERLWLAPRLRPGTTLDPAWLEVGPTLLVDTYHAGGYGGSGLTGDWGQFKQWREQHPKHTWILSGGLKADNIGAALAATGARVIDVGSGVEAAAGIKDARKLEALAAALRSRS